LGVINVSELLELLWFQQCVNEVRKKKHSGDSTDDVIHGLLLSLKPIAGLRKTPGQHKEEQSNEDVKQISHIHFRNRPDSNVAAGT
jgi:hypothetical protein